jgi:hypothetical protein
LILLDQFAFIVIVKLKYLWINECHFDCMNACVLMYLNLNEKNNYIFEFKYEIYIWIQSKFSIKCFLQEECDLACQVVF